MKSKLTFLLLLLFGFINISMSQNISDDKEPVMSIRNKSVLTKDGKTVSLEQNTPTAPRRTITSWWDGNWSNPLIWNTLTVPTATDNVIINNNVTVANNDYQCNSLTVNSGKTLRLYSTWWLYVHGNLTNNGTITLDTGTSSYSTMLFLLGDISNYGTISDASSYSAIYFAGSAKQTFTNSGTITPRIYNMDIDNTYGVTISSTNNIPVFRVNLFDGFITNSSKLTIGDGQTGVVQRGGNQGNLASGYFDSAPALNLGTNPNLYLIYYTALPITTGYEIPASTPVYYFRSVNIQGTTLNSNVTITNSLVLDSGQFNITANTITLNDGAIVVGNGTISGGATSNLTFTGSTAATLPKIINGLNNLTINNSGGVTMTADNKIIGTAVMTNGLLNTGNYTLTFDTTATNPIERSSSRIVGKALISNKFVGTGSIYFLNCRIAGGTSDIGKVSITRTTGKAVTIGGNSGILSYWSVSTSIVSPNATRDITYEWLSQYDNGHAFSSSNKAQIYKSSDGTTWTGSGSLADVSSSDPRTITTAGESPTMNWTVSSQDAPLPVTLQSFSANVNTNNVTLKWITSEEINNAGFDVERSISSDNQFVKIGFVKGNGTTKSTSEYAFSDRNLNSGKYQYRLKQIDNNGNFEYHNLSGTVNITVPTKFELMQNYPNPFNPVTKIGFSIPEDGKIKLSVYDITGKEVSILANETKVAGYYTMQFNGERLSSGVYFYRLDFSGISGSSTQVKRMVLVK